MSEKTIETIPLDGGKLCFDFINTVSGYKSEERIEYLPDYYSLLKWCNRVEAMPDGKIGNLKKEARVSLQNAEKAIRSVIKVRDVLHQVFSSITQNKKPDATAWDEFNKRLGDSLSRTEFNFHAHEIVADIKTGKDELIAPLHMIMKSCYDVLTKDDRQRIKECPSCGWIFYDTTKNNKRQWCNPMTCGSIDKSKRYYWKNKARKEE